MLKTKIVSNDSGRPSIFSDDYKKNQFKTSLNNQERCKILQQPSAVKNLWRKFSLKSDDSAYDYKIERFMSDKDSGVAGVWYEILIFLLENRVVIFFHYVDN